MRILLTTISILIAQSLFGQYGTVTHGGVSYKWMTFGTKNWMIQNLMYKPGTGKTWSYDNNTSNNIAYGLLYDFQAAKSACPSGWRLPSKADWMDLKKYLEEQGVSGFNPTYGGYAWKDYGTKFAFGYKDGIGQYWTSDVSNNDIWAIEFGASAVPSFFWRHREYGISVRCVCEASNMNDGQSGTQGGGTSEGLKNISDNTLEDKFNIYQDKILSDKTTSFIKDLAANTNNPDLKQFAKDLNIIDETNQKVAQYNSMFDLTPSQSDIEFNNVMNNAMQGLATAKFVINLFKEDEVELSPSQKQARIAMLQLWQNVKMIYDETKSIPWFTYYNKEDINRISELEQSYIVYDLATAIDRYTLIRFFWSSRRYDITEVQNIYNEISMMEPIDILRKIDAWQSTANIGSAMHLPNSDVSFNLNKNVLAIKKARCYRNVGEEARAIEIMNSINFNISTFEALKLMYEAFNATDYEGAMSFYPIAKSYFENEEFPKARYLFDTDKSNNSETNPFLREVGNDFYLPRNELIKLLSCGVYSSIINENYSQAFNELKFLEAYVKNKPVDNAYTKIDENEEEVILLSMKSSYYLLINETEKAKEKIDQAILLEKTLPLGTYKPWVQFIKFKQLGAAKEFDQAHELYREIIKNPLLSNNDFSAYIDVEELKFQKCLLLYEQKEYERVLNGLDMLELITPKLKYKLLRSQVFTALGKEREAVEILRH